jgi:MFS family permease
VNRTTLDRLRRRPGYARLWGTATLARLSNEMAPVAVVLYVLEQTGSATAAGATVAGFALPSLVSGPLLGAWLDRSARRVRLIALDQLVTGASLAGVALLAGSVPAWVLPLVALPAGVMLPLSSGGLTSLMPATVGDDLLLAANALEASSFNLAIIAGPALAGTLAAAAGTLAAVLAQAGLKLGALVLVSGIRDAGRPVPAADASVARTAKRGLRHVLATPPLLAVTTAGAVSLAGRGLLVAAFPFFAVEQLSEGRSFAGYLWAAFAAGSIAGAVGTVRLQERWPPARTALASVAACGVVMLAWPLAESAPAALAVIALAGLVYGPGFAATFGVRQQWAPAELHGQVFMTAASLKVGSFALGAAVSGLLVSGLGGRGTLVLAAGLHVLAGAAGALLAARRRAGVSRVPAAP